MRLTWDSEVLANLLGDTTNLILCADGSVYMNYAQKSSSNNGGLEIFSFTITIKMPNDDMMCLCSYEKKTTVDDILVKSICETVFNKEVDVYDWVIKVMEN